MNQDQLKREVARAALDYVEDGMLLGVGTGSTVNCFIDLLAESGTRIDAAVSSSEASTEKLQHIGVKVIDLNQSGPLEVYIDGADEVDPHRRLIKGGGGALTREKIIAGSSRKFVCIVDQSKQVKVLGHFPLPVEVIPMARSFVARKMVEAGGQPVFRDGFVTDNGNHILDVHNLDLVDPITTEGDFNAIPGVVTVGLFARRGADVVLMASPDGVTKL
jgi:ribose 5-phosphate isomerase A